MKKSLFIFWSIVLFFWVPKPAQSAESAIDFSSINVTDSIPELQEYPTRDKARLFFREYPAESEIGLILIHGSSGHSGYFSKLATSLVKTGAVSVYTPDMRGHGHHPLRRGDIDYIGQLEDDIDDLISYILKKNPSIRKIVLGGHSSGGGFVLRFSKTKYSERIASFLLLAPYLGYDAPTTRPNSGGWASPKIGTFLLLDLINKFGIVSLNHWTTLRFNLPDQFRSGSETSEYSYRLSKNFQSENYESEVKSIKKPLLVLVGKQDEAFYAEKYKQIFNELNPQARVELIDNCKHISLVTECFPLEVISAWLH